MAEIRWFKISVITSFIVLCGMMLYVVIIAAQRKDNGSLGIDAAKIQQMRSEANKSKPIAEIDP